ncbi:MAG: hypothetical protein KDD25_05080, partial [Bdellovibrionales bacterium]|nr:hypothetical protein [Bdellovibrionales bacterium]
MRSILLVTFSLVLASCGARSVQHNVGGSADSGTKPSDTVVILGGSSDGATDSVTCLAEDSDTGSQEDNFPYGDFVTNTKSNEIKLMAYNLENLFDTEHDVVNGQDKNDYFYLPANHPLKDKCGSDKRCKEFDWNDSKLTLKIDRLAKVIESQGDLPDVIGFEEIENAKVLGKLADRLGYSKQNLVITQGPDERGIEVAVLYKTDKLTFVESKEHGVDPGNDRPTRDVLEVVFDINLKPGERLAVYVNHWPSQGTPMSGWKRSSAAMTL